jgi:hypothetical protein
MNIQSLSSSCASRGGAGTAASVTCRRVRRVYKHYVTKRVRQFIKLDRVTGYPIVLHIDSMKFEMTSVLNGH